MNHPAQIEKSSMVLQHKIADLLAIESSHEIKNAVLEIQNLVNLLVSDLEKVQAESNQAKQEKAKFISVVTHELRIPLTSIKGYSDLLRQGIVGAVNEQQVNFLNVIRNNVERMSALIADLSDMSHIQSGRLKLQPQSTDVRFQINELLKTWQPRFEGKNQLFKIALPDNLIPRSIDPARFMQILEYILNNAHRYTPNDGSITLRVTAKESTLSIEVEDNGIGINDEDQKMVFEPFYRSEDPAVREFPGWGLSLHVAKLLVELMGGEIGFTSEYGKGSTFWFSVPVI